MRDTTIPERITLHPGRLEEHLRPRLGGTETATAGATALRDLLRYYETLESELRRVRLEDAEWMLLRDALNGYVHTPGIRADAALLAQVEDAIQLDGLAKKWETDGDGLLAKLRALTPTQALAVVDAAERWWLTEG